MADDDARYTRKLVRTLRGREARTIAKWRNEGWELVRQSQGRLRTQMTFRREKPKSRRLLVAVSGALILAVVVIAATTHGPAMVRDVDERFTVDAVAHIKESDGDGLADSVERAGWRAKRGGIYVTDPNSADTDEDGLSDGEEAGSLGMTPWGQAYAGLSDPTEQDSDGDGLDDATEHDGAFDPWAEDSDGDSVNDLVEIEFGSDPLTTNADGDHLDDAEEIRDGSDPDFYDLTIAETLEAFAAGATFNWGLSDEQVDSWPYLAGLVVKSFKGVNVRRIISRVKAVRTLMTKFGSRQWGAAFQTLVGVVSRQEMAKAVISAIRFAEKGDRAARAAMNFIGSVPVLNDQAKADAIRTIVRITPAKVQLVADAAVTGTPAPEALFTQRPISTSDSQNARKDEIVLEFQSQGYTDIRVNQAQANATGDLVGINRPDIQATAPDGTRHYVVLDTTSSDRGPSHMVRILCNDDSGQVLLIEQD